MSDVSYDDDFPEEFDAQHEDAEETSPYLLMSSDDFRLHVVGMLNQGFENQKAIHDATEAGFKAMEERLRNLEMSVATFQKKAYGNKH